MTLKRLSGLYIVTKNGKQYYFLTLKNALHFIEKQPAARGL